MGLGNPTLRKDAVRTRRAILDSANDLFQVDQEASHAEIARAAGVGRASVYRHFPERQDIVVALLDEMIDRLEEIAAAQGGPVPFVDLLRATAREQARYLGLISVMRRDGVAPERLAALEERVLALYDEPLAAAKREGIVRGDLALKDVPLLLVMIEGALSQVADPVERGEYSSRALDLLLQGVLAG
jgi:AcrR family transcriptional regulator